MKVSFDIEMDDMLSFQKHFINTSPTMKKAKRMVTYLFPLFIIIFSFFTFYSRYNRIDISFIVVMAIVSALWVIFVPRFFVSNTLKRAKKILSKPGNEVMFGTFEMTFTDNGFDVKTATTQSNILWSAVPKIDETNNYFYVYLSQASAYIIPKNKISATDVENLRSVFSQHLLK